MKKLKLFCLAILAGMAIGIGGIVYLTLDIKIVGALMFTVGLYTICVHGLNLFTGKVGYLFENKPDYIIDLLIIWAGNFIGTWIDARLVLASRISGLSETARSLCEVKEADTLVSLFILGIFCGMLMYIAVEGFKKTGNPLILFVCVAVFILCGTEHCVADMFYFSLACRWNAGSVLSIIVISLGNAVGSWLIPLAHKIRVKDEPQ